MGICACDRENENTGKIESSRHTQIKERKKGKGKKGSRPQGELHPMDMDLKTEEEVQVVIELPGSCDNRIAAYRNRKIKTIKRQKEGVLQQ